MATPGGEATATRMGLQEAPRAVSPSGKGPRPRADGRLAEAIGNIRKPAADWSLPHQQPQPLIGRLHDTETRQGITRHANEVGNIHLARHYANLETDTAAFLRKAASRTSVKNSFFLSFFLSGFLSGFLSFFLSLLLSFVSWP